MPEPHGQSGVLARADRFGRLLENSLLIGLLAAMLLLGLAQIVMRNFLDAGFGWADEALRIMVLWLAMLGAVAASRDDRHISIDILARILPARWRAAAAAAMAGFAAAVAWLLAWHSGVFVLEAREYGDQLLGDLPAWAFQLILPVAFALIGYRYTLLCVVRWFRWLRGALAA